MNTAEPVRVTGSTVFIRTLRAFAQIDQNSRTVYERIPAHGSLSRQQFSMGFFHSQVAKSSCQVVDYVTAS
jgi:hypothetical protein